MKRNTVNLIVDSLAGVTMLSLIGTGIVLRLVLPPRSGPGFWLWGLDRHEWGDVHALLAVALTGLACVHVTLHWSWVLSVLGVPAGNAAGAKRGRVRPAAIGLAFVIALAALLAGFWALAAGHVRRTGRESNSRTVGQVAAHAEERPGRSPDIRGSMNLEEVGAEMNLALDDVRRRLGLPSDVSGSARLGQLAKTYGFTISDARVRLRNVSDGPSATAIAGSEPSED